MKKHKKIKMLDDFLREMETSNKSRNTIINYRSDLRNFLDKCPADIENLTTEILRTHLDGLNNRSYTTRARHISSLRKFLDWCYKKDLINDRSILKIENNGRYTTGHPVKKIERSEIERVISLIGTNNLKYKLIFTLMLEAGLKIHEVLNLKYHDIEADTRTILVNSGYIRRIPLFSSESIDLFRTYTEKMNIKTGLIFKGAELNDKTLSYQALNKFWRKCCSKANADIKLHQLRDCYADSLAGMGIDISVIKRMLGHKCIQSTIRYFNKTEVTGK